MKIILPKNSNTVQEYKIRGGSRFWKSKYRNIILEYNIKIRGDKLFLEYRWAIDN